MSELGERIRRERRRRGERQVDLAERLNTTQATVWRWENGENRPDIDQFAAVAHYLGITVDEMYSLAMDTPMPSSLTGLQGEVDQLRRELATLTSRLTDALARIDALERPPVAPAKSSAKKAPSKAAAKAAGKRSPARR